MGAGGDLQAALNSASPGDTILLASGAQYVGNFVLPVKPGSAFITITTSGFNPVSGKRMLPTDAVPLAKILSSNASAAIAVSAGAHHFLLLGLEIATAPGVYNYGIVELTSPVSGDATTIPHDIILDSLYIHGDPVAGSKRGVSLNSASTTIQNSYISDIKSTFQDSQAICGWDGPGPFIIVNNYLEASGENLMFGGAAPSIANQVPSDITIQYNYFYKQPAWKGSQWIVKNLLELKDAQRVTIQYNVLENNWAGSQSGYGVLFTVRTCEGGNTPWAVVKNILYSYNILRNSDEGFVVAGEDGERTGCPPPVLAGYGGQIVIANNLFDGTSTADLFLIEEDTDQLTVEHNTAFSTRTFVWGTGTPSPSFVLRDNILNFGLYGMIGDGTGGEQSTCAAYFPGCSVTNNVLLGIPAASESAYSSTNFFSAAGATVFANPAAGDYSLLAGSPYKGMATDGTDPGVNLAELLARTANVTGAAPALPAPPAAPPAPPVLKNSTIWNITPQPNETSHSDGGVTLGLKFRSDTPGTISAIQFFKETGQAGLHLAGLWTSSGTLLANATFTSEADSGWQQANFSSPVPILANTTYVAGYYTGPGWCADSNYFEGKGADASPLHALADGVDGGNGVASYGGSLTFPVSSRGANYWLDVVFAPAIVVVSPAPPVSPTVPGSSTIWTINPQPNETSHPDGGVTLGVKFRTDAAGTIGSIRFFKGAGQNGVHQAGLWNSNGVLLASGTFAAETASGWQQFNFSAPVPIVANTTYVAGYLTGPGWSADSGYFEGKGADAAPLHALADGVDGGNGVASYGTSLTFPINSRGANYWVDVVFTPTPGALLPAPAGPATNSTIWNIIPQPNETMHTDGGVTLGLKFNSSVPGTITGIRFFKEAGQIGVHQAGLWTSQGVLLANATFTNETDSGWQQVNFAAPVAIVAGSTYVAGYLTGAGWCASSDYFDENGVNASPLYALADGVDGGNGVASYGDMLTFPISSRGANYWVDVVFTGAGNSSSLPSVFTKPKK